MFIEISTIAACALVMVKDSGPTLVATVRYLFLSLLGSGMFLFGLVLLYAVTGHLLMPQLTAAVAELAAAGERRGVLALSLGLMTAGLGVKSAMFPFHRWLPDAHGSATTASSAVLSGLVVKGYAVLLILLYVRVFTPDTVRALRVSDAVFVLGFSGMILGSVRAIGETHVKRMLAWSTVAQLGYVFMGVGRPASRSWPTPSPSPCSSSRRAGSRRSRGMKSSSAPCAARHGARRLPDSASASAR